MRNHPLSSYFSPCIFCPVYPFMSFGVGTLRSNQTSRKKDHFFSIKVTKTTQDVHLDIFFWNFEFPFFFLPNPHYDFSFIFFFYHHFPQIMNFPTN